MTTTDTAKAAEILRQIAARFVEFPQSIKVAATRAADGDWYFGLSCHIDDEGKLIGKSRSHADAFAFLVHKMGRACGEKWFFRLITNGTPRKQEPEPKPRAERYNALPTADLLAQIMTELPIAEFKLDVVKGTHPELPAFQFTISVRENADYCALTYIDHDFGGASPTTIVGALGTLFRAIARNDGVWFQIVVRRKNERAP